MEEKTKFKNSKILTSNWVITLTATLIGVFGALFLNEWVSSYKLKNQKSIATKNVLAEISSNSEKVEKASIKHIQLIDVIEFMAKYSDDENATLIAPADSMKKFQSKYPNIVVLEDSTLISNQTYQYNGEINFNFSTPQLEITTIAWKTLKSSGISPTYGFDCLMYLEGLYNITDEVSEKNEVLLEYFIGEKEVGEKSENLINHLNLLVDYEELLVKMYESSEKELAKCG